MAEAQARDSRHDSATADLRHLRRVIDDSDESKIELDHVVPIANGGEAFPDRNGLRLTHKACNARRRNNVEPKQPSPARRNGTNVSPWLLPPT